VHGDPAQIAALDDVDLAGMATSADLDVGARQRVSDRCRRAHRSLGAAEVREEAVTGRVDLPSSLANASVELVAVMVVRMPAPAAEEEHDAKHDDQDRPQLRPGDVREREPKGVAKDKVGTDDHEDDGGDQSAPVA
jgi:hypothetical protein